MAQSFTRPQTQVIFRHLPGAIFEHEDYGLSFVDGVTVEGTEVNKEALFDVMSDLLTMWSDPRFVEKFPDPRDEKERRKYTIGLPKEVRFEPYPTTFICRKCHRAYRYEDLARKRATDSAQCKSCGGTLARMRYVQAHNCGRIEELYVPTQCKKCQSADFIAFEDPGRVKHARWYCTRCKIDLQAMRQTPCKCAYSDSINAAGGSSSEQRMKVVPTGDASLHIVHTAAFVNFPDTADSTIRAVADAHAIVMARIWGLLTSPVDDLIRSRAKQTNDAADDALARTVAALRNLDPNNSMVLEFDRNKAAAAGQSVTVDVDNLLKRYGVGLFGVPRRWAIEHVTLMDRTSVTSTSDVAVMLRRRGDAKGADDIEAAAQTARQLLGIRRVRIINDFPITLAAFGYTRLARDPSRAMLSPFVADERGKFPVFAVSSETEAIWFELDPGVVLSWLRANGFIAQGAHAGDADAWAQLLAYVPGLGQRPSEPAYDDKAAQAVRTLIHTMSHVFMRRIEWSGFSPSSICEYLLPGSLSFVIYANRYVDSCIGGLTTLFEQRLGTWLWDAVQSGRECVYDPICEDDGGTCAGCTHREHNCALFNRDLSRATLYGGPAPQSSTIGTNIRDGFWDRAWAAAPTA